MNFIRFAIENPVKVTVAVLLVVLFGFLSVLQIPIQLTPNVDQPRVTITTLWDGAGPEEIEREIIERQEEKLKGINNLKKMNSTSRQSQGEVVLEFHVGVDKDDALRDTIERINQVSNYPPEVERPSVVAADSALASPIAWLIFSGPKDSDTSTLKDYAEDHIKPILERVPGVASVDVFGGREREMQVRIDPHKLAARGLSFNEVADALRRQNRNVSAGTIIQGKRDTVVRTLGQYESPEEILDTVLAYREGGPIYVRDVVRSPNPDGSRPGVEASFKKRTGFVRSRGHKVLALPVRREAGSNVIAVMRGLRENIEYVNRALLKPRGDNLILDQVYDETIYIESAISLVRTNLVFGGALALIVLVLFLRSASATVVVALTIPISVVGTFLVVALMGRTLNVVMLAGMAFAVGMIVDSAIVVLENIFRHRQMGKDRVRAALEGTQEVWGAVLASTLTTVAVFLPIVFVKEEAGQLFRDIAIAIVVAVSLSLVVAVTVIPTLGSRMLGKGRADSRTQAHDGRVALFVAGLVERMNRHAWSKLGVIVSLAALSVLGSYLLAPPATYLPTGNRNLVFGFLVTPPGYSVEEFERIGNVIEEGRGDDLTDGLRYSWETELGSERASKLAPVQMRIGDEDAPQMIEVTPPPIDNFFYVAFGNNCFMGATSKDPDRVTPLINKLSDCGAKVPGTFSFFFQTSLFGEVSGGGGNSIELELRGENLNEVRQAAEMLMPQLMNRFQSFPRPDPVNFNLGQPEARAVPNRAMAADLGLSVQELGFIVRTCVDGAYLGEYHQMGDSIDLTLIVDGTECAMTRDIANIPIFAPAGKVVPLSSVLDFVTTTAPQQINHIEEQPAIKFSIQVPEAMPLQTAMDTLEDEIIRPMREQGLIGPNIVTALAGNADKLVQTRHALFGEWTGLNGSSLANLAQSRGFLALLVTYLLMAALFESFAYPVVILFTVPLATLGGFAALGAMHFWTARNPIVPTQQLDVLTMVGFIMLIGIVVNNAILLVHQALNFMRNEQMPYDQAIVASVRTRIRPIFMTALTTVFGQLPLVLMPGAGSELYRGIGSVLLGGLLLSTVFTLVLVPAMFSAMLDLKSFLMGGRMRAGLLPEATPHRQPVQSRPGRAPCA